MSVETYITLTYQSAPTELRKGIRQLEKWTDNIVAHTEWTFEFYPEYGRKTGRLHWHGVIRIKQGEEPRLYQILGIWASDHGRYYIVERDNPSLEDFILQQNKYMRKQYDTWHVRIDNDYKIRMLNMEITKRMPRLGITKWFK